MSNDVKSIVRFLKAYGNFSTKQREVGWPCWPWPRPPGSRSSASSCFCRARRTWTGAGRCRRSSARTWRSSRPPTWRSPASRPWPAKQSRFVLRTTSVRGNIAGCMILNAVINFFTLLLIRAARQVSNWEVSNKRILNLSEQTKISL